MNALLIYALLTPALFYLGSRAVITSWLWSRYPPKLARFMDCAACSGFWYGVAVSLALRLPVYPGDVPTGSENYPGSFVLTPFVVGLCAIVWTPIVAGIMQAGFERLGSVVEDDGPQE